jgi:hypothetical protein
VAFVAICLDTLAALGYDPARFRESKERSMKIDRNIIIIDGVLLLAALLAGCGTGRQATPPPTSPTSPSVMTSQPLPALGTAYPAPTGYPAPDNPGAAAYPAPTGTP